MTLKFIPLLSPYIMKYNIMLHRKYILPNLLFGMKNKFKICVLRRTNFDSQFFINLLILSFFCLNSYLFFSSYQSIKII